ncbi:11798_t:CDS:2, partial [Paraglomus brasilianum]
KTKGMEKLLNMLTANQHKLGYSPPEDAKALVDSIPDFDYETVLRQEALDLNNELNMLQTLKDCEQVPKVISTGTLSDGRMFMLTTPVGKHLEAKKHGLKGTLKALLDIARALKFAHSHHILHHDVSY